MKRLLTLFLIINLICLIETAYSLPWPPDVDIVEISFNYYTGSFDGIALKKNSSTSVPIPEWKAGVRNEKFAYKRNQAEIFIKTKFWMDRDGEEFDVGIYADQYAGGGIGDVSETRVTFDFSHYSDPKTMITDGSGISSVGRRKFKWKWYVTYINYTEFEEPIYIGSTGYHRYYTVLSTPQSPMAVPWTSVLEYACDWAKTKTSESSAVSEITKGAYNDFGDDHEYDGDGTHASGTTFDLSGFLSEDWADCRDMSAVVHVFTKAIGGTATKVRKIYGGFAYKPILPIGYSNWGSGVWNFHQVGYKSNVYDACLKLDQSNPRIPTNEAINGIYKDDLFNYGYWNPGTSFNYSNVY